MSTPTTISGLQIWYDGSDPNNTGTAPANGATISTWKNKASTGATYDAVAGNSFTYAGLRFANNAATYNSTYYALNFNNASYSTGSYTGNPTSETAFIVFKNPSPNINNPTLIGGTYGARSYGCGYYFNTGTNGVGVLTNQIAWRAGTPAGSYVSNTTAIATFKISSGTSYASIYGYNSNNYYTASGTTFSTGSTTWLGIDTTNSSYTYNGYAMDIIIYNTVLTASDITKVQTYLYNKWIVPTPTSVTAVQNTSDADTAVTVSWAKPTTYGSTIQSYTVTSNPGGRTATATGENTLSATVTGLSSNTAYTFTVTAYNGKTSAASTPSSSVTPRVSSVAGSVSGAPGSNVAVGSSTTLSLSGSTGTAWQWQSSTDGTSFSNIVGATSSTYSTSNVNSTNSNVTVYYRSVVTNYSRSSATTAAISITTAPSSVAGTIGSVNVGNLAYGDNSTALTLSAYRGTIQWQSSSDNSIFTNITGATNYTYTPTNLTATKYYRAVVTSSPNTAVTSPSITLTVDGQTTLSGINAHDNNQNTDEGITPEIGYNKTVTLTLSGVAGTVQWSSSPDNSSWTNIGTNSSTYTSGVLQSRIYYKATVKNGNSASITSDTVTVTVDGASTVGTVTATYTTIGYNESTTLSVSDTTGTVYWQSSLDNGVTDPYADISSATGTSYTITNGTASKYYRVRVVNGESDSVSALGILITVDAASVAGTITGAETHASYNRTKTLTLSSYTGSIVWKTATTLTGTYTVISGETGASYTTPALTATTYYKAVVTNGESDPAESLVTVIVDAKSASTVTASGTTSYTYNGSAQGPASTSNVTGSAGTVTYSYSGTANGGASHGPSSTKPTNAGSYTMIATVAEDDYYLGGSSSAYSFTIDKGASTISATGTQSFIYNTSSQGPASSSKTGSSSSATYSYVGISGTSGTSYGPSSVAPTNAGSYELTASVTADDNYNSASSSAYSFSIAKANSSISVTGDTSFSYNGSAQGPSTSTVSGSTGVVTYSYEGRGTTTYGPSSTAPTLAGEYFVDATVSADANYLTDSNRFIFEILAPNAQSSEDIGRINQILDNVGSGTNSFMLNLQDFVTTDIAPEYIPSTIVVSTSAASNGTAPVEIALATGKSVSVDGLSNGFFAAVGVNESATYGTVMTINLVDDKGNVPTTPATLTLTLSNHEGESGLYAYLIMSNGRLNPNKMVATAASADSHNKDFIITNFIPQSTYYIVAINSVTPSSETVALVPNTPITTINITSSIPNIASITADDLPPGLQLSVVNQQGYIDGTPTAPLQSYTTTITVQGTNGAKYMGLIQFVFSTVACFVEGTRVLTQNGYKAVEALLKDDYVVTADKRIADFKLYKTTLKNAASNTAPYVIQPHAFGHNIPSAPLRLSPHHKIRIAKGLWSSPEQAAKTNPLVKQYGIGEPVTYYHIECANYLADDLVAEGMIVESYGTERSVWGLYTPYTWSERLMGFTRISPAHLSIKVSKAIAKIKERAENKNTWVKKN